VWGTRNVLPSLPPLVFCTKINPSKTSKKEKKEMKDESISLFHLEGGRHPERLGEA
jgi:hypothetical protein